MKKTFIGMSLLCLTLLGCGKVGHISSPADGQTFTLTNGGFGSFQVTLDNGNYGGTTITFKGTVPPQVSCVNSNNAPMVCSYVNNNSGGTQACNPTCTVVIETSDNSGNVADAHVVYFTTLTSGH